MQPDLIEDLGMKYANENSKQKKRFGIYRCPGCNLLWTTQSHTINSGATYQCKSCASKEKSITHGQAKNGKTKLYRKWSAMKTRCLNTDHKYYGGKGIIVCQEWHNFETFKEWAETHSYEDHLSIERIESDGNYEPSNCEWIPISENRARALFKRMSKKAKDDSQTNTR